MSYYVIPVQEAAKTVTYRTKADKNAKTILTLVGLLAAETLIVEVPRVANPVAATDAHWTPLKVAGASVTFTSTVNFVELPNDITIRLKKALSTGNAFGVKAS